MTEVDPRFPRYLIPETMIDGPRKTDGELEFTLLCRAVVVPDDDKLAQAEPIQLRVYDFGGPRTPAEPLEAADAAVAAALEVAKEAGALPYLEGTEEDTVRNEDFIRHLLGAADERMPHVSGETVICLDCLKIAAPSCGHGGDGLATLDELVDSFSNPEPKRDLDPGPIPPQLLTACAARVSELISAHFAESIEDPTPEELAAAVLTEIGRRLHPGDDDAVSLVLGVLKLDVKKLTTTGDEMADGLRRADLDGFEELLATWKGQAHRDWSDLRALRRST